MKIFGLKASLLLMAILLFTDCLIVEGQACHPSGKIRVRNPLLGNATKAMTPIAKDEDGGAPSECDNQYHSDDTPVVALSTGWYNKGSRCLNNITISANGRSVVAMVVDECDSTMGMWTVTTIISLPVLTTLLMPQELCGKPWGCLMTNGEG
ncbi:putative ripening-related protein 2 [Vitis vinifera]|uniref:Putative ripening-related protein 2 n=1 Tax=Vitis vinifera TaxID=29760 RepID=A0A438D5C6_VITVI|nr:putative ripening-related protein 2 [Vitis vinifera]